ncbi:MULTISPECIES: PAS domain S-box protein [unclassified Flavobacterium]|uniref:PAS domain-containing protein n=1 Tax=unclassified Flavobacterium TaxID=196869 RepID=UPI003F93F0F2
MRISFEKKIFLGFIINVLIVLVSGLIFITRINVDRDIANDSFLNWIEITLFILSIILLVVVYFIIRSQLEAKNKSQKLLSDSRKLLLSIIDNTTNPIFIKKIDGEYLLVNRQFGKLLKITTDEILGKTDYDFLPKNIADAYRDSDLEVVKKLQELKTEETIIQENEPHTYIAVKFPLYDSNDRIYAIGGISTDITDRKKLENSLKAADKFFNMSLDMMVIAKNDLFIRVNPAACKILGYSEDELTTSSYLKFIHPEDQDVTKQEITKLEQGNLTIKFENRWIAQDGSIKWLLWSSSPDVETGLLYAVARDVTEQKETEKSLLSAEKFFNMSYDMLAVGKGDYFVKVNPAFTRTLGYDQKDMDHKTFLSFTHPEDTQASIDAINKLKKGESLISLRARARCKDGSYKWLDWTSTIDIVTGDMFAVARDVTKLVEFEESLKMTDSFFDMAFDILTVAKEEHYIKINPAFTKTLGYDQNDLNQIKFTDLTHDDDKLLVEKVLEELLKGEPIVSFKNRIRCKDESYKWIHWHCSYDPVKGIIYMVGRDISEQIRIENEEKVIINNLYENEEKLRLILENIGDGVIVANVEKEIIMANYVANEIFEIEEGEKISLNLTDHFQLYFPDEKTIFPSQNLPMERALNGEVTNDIDIVLWDPTTKNKKRVLISGRPLIDQNENVVAAVVTIKDISKYKEMEKELIKTESKYRKLIGFRKDEESEESEDIEDKK